MWIHYVLREQLTTTVRARSACRRKLNSLMQTNTITPSRRESQGAKCCHSTSSSGSGGAAHSAQAGQSNFARTSEYRAVDIHSISYVSLLYIEYDNAWTLIRPLESVEACQCISYTLIAAKAVGKWFICQSIFAPPSPSLISNIPNNILQDGFRKDDPRSIGYTTQRYSSRSITLPSSLNSSLTSLSPPWPTRRARRGNPRHPRFESEEMCLSNRRHEAEASPRA